MKPKDLKPPFTWENRRVILNDQVLFIPDYYQNYQEYPPIEWEDPTIFGNSNPVKIEFCSGNGAWIAERAKNYPQYNWVAIEKRFDRCRKIWSKAKNESLKNLLIVCSEGYRFSNHYLLNSTIDEVFVNFPDPWPKKKHIKHRIIQTRFADEISRLLMQGKKIVLATDDADYRDIMIETFLNHSNFQSITPHPYYTTSLDCYGSSYFRQLWEGLNRTIYFLQFEKKS